MKQLVATAIFALIFGLINIQILSLITHAIAGFTGGLLHLVLFIPVVFGSVGLVLFISYIIQNRKVES